MNEGVGHVYFVGAGPGDPKLITVKGAECLAQADVIVYDRLVQPEMMSYAKKEVETIYCGKLPQCHPVPQEEINEILVQQAKLGKLVVRLKGGDPSIFGRVGEEAAYCKQHGISYEIVPGITSGIAAPMYAGIPLTHRDLSSSVAFVTGHKRSDGKGHTVQWDKLATSVDTLVFYMGVSQIRTIQEELVRHGKPGNTPVALVRWGTLKEQETLVGTLETIADDVESKGFSSPAIIVVGAVVSLRETLAWVEEHHRTENQYLVENMGGA